jgi:hypothetical protein
MEAVYSSETLVTIYQTARCYNPEDADLTFTHKDLETVNQTPAECCFDYKLGGAVGEVAAPSRRSRTGTKVSRDS